MLMKESAVKSFIGLCEAGMMDSRVDVRLAASACFLSLISSASFSATRRDKVLKRLIKAASTKVSKGASPEAIAKRHGGVLGLSAFVASHPYDLPEYVPAVLARLADHINDPPPIVKPLRKLFTDFKSTHQDQWLSKWKDQFSPDELEVRSKRAAFRCITLAVNLTAITHSQFSFMIGIGVSGECTHVLRLTEILVLRFLHSKAFVFLWEAKSRVSWAIAISLFAPMKSFLSR